jgi:hypothetical protein
MFGMQPYSNPTRRNVEDNLNIFENGRRPQFFWKRKTTLFKKNKTTSFKKIEPKAIIFLKMEDDPNCFEKGRRPHCF